MATIPLFLQSPLCSLAPSSPKLFQFRAHRNPIQPRVQCVVISGINKEEVSRRSANYQPSIWHYDFIQSLESDYKDEPYVSRVEELKREVTRLLNVTDEPLARLELIDKLHRLGISYHFKGEIKSALHTIFLNSKGSDDLHATALCFRLLRQHGYKVTPGVFSNFMQEDKIFKTDLCGDARGMLSLYDASELGYEGEIIIDRANAFSSGHLKSMMGQLDPRLAKEVEHSLELPLHRRIIRLEARWYIGFYEEEEGMNPALLELAKLDYNIVQAIYQRDIKKVSAWWRDQGLGEKLQFARNRLMECFFWGVGIAFDPKLVELREAITKVIQLITTIDDIYDVYGSLEELEIFTDAVDRWDLKAMDQLPYYMKLCFLSLYNTTNGATYSTLKNQGLDNTKYLQKAWANLCKAYLVEVKWYNEGYMPTLEEYLENGWVSISGHVVLVHAFFLAGHEITKEEMEFLENYPRIIQWSSVIVRLCDDLGTSTAELERGDVPKSIQCYMNQAGVSEEIAREHMKDLLTNTWKKLNEECANSSPRLPQTFINICINSARMAQCMYQHGDGHGVADKDTKERVVKLMVEPIQI